LTTCQKSGSGYVRGTVLESGTGLPISGIKVYVTDMKHGSTHQNNTGSDISDENGNYEIRYYKKNMRRYFVSAESNDNYTIAESMEISFKKFAYSVEMFPKAYLKIRVKKTAFSTNSFSGRINGIIDIGNISNQYPYDTIIPKTFKVNGVDKTNIEWFIYFNNSSYPNHNSNYDQIYITKNDTVTYTITFN
jgi:hypothetical protein